MAVNTPVCVDDLEKYALSKLPKVILDKVQSGAGAEATVADNRRAFKRYKLRPRCLVDVSETKTHTTVLGYDVAMPVLIAPVGTCKMIHKHGEVAIARAAALMKTAYSLSTCASSGIEEIAAATPGGLNIFQLYMLPSREGNEKLLRKAETSGYKAVMLTVDTPVFPDRRADIRNRFELSPEFNYAVIEEGVYGNRNGSPTPPRPNTLEHNSAMMRCAYNSRLRWADIQWMSTVTTLPIILKGILTGEDARKAVEYGASGVVVSNHGGRLQDDFPATIDALEEVVKAVNGRCEVYLDSGVRTGSDVFKALARGARAVFVGRPILYGLAYDGENGVVTMLKMLRDELKKTMAYTGCNAIDDIHPGLVVHESYYHPSRL